MTQRIHASEHGHQALDCPSCHTMSESLYVRYTAGVRFAFCATCWQGIDAHEQSPDTKASGAQR